MSAEGPLITYDAPYVGASRLRQLIFKWIGRAAVEHAANEIDIEITYTKCAEELQKVLDEPMGKKKKNELIPITEEERKKLIKETENRIDKLTQKLSRRMRKANKTRARMEKAERYLHELQLPAVVPN